jgi:hypothetical protein
MSLSICINAYANLLKDLSYISVLQLAGWTEEAISVTMPLLGWMWRPTQAFQLRFSHRYTVYGVRNTGCLQISTKKFPQIRRNNFFNT